MATRPVEVRRAGFILSNGEEVFLTPYRVEPGVPPRVVGDGESIRFHYRANGERAVDECVEVERAFVSGGRDRQWEGEPDEWLRPLHVPRNWWQR